MLTQYVKDQPAGFINQIEKVALVGVSHLSIPEKKEAAGGTPLLTERPSRRPADALARG